jgi:hypothetical protein
MIVCPVGEACWRSLSDMGSDRIVWSHVEHFCSTGLFGTASDNSVRCRVGQHLSDELKLIGPWRSTIWKLLKIFERPHNSRTIGPMSYKLIGQWLFDMGSNTLSNPTLKKSVKQPCPTWDRTEWSNHQGRFHGTRRRVPLHNS